MNRWTLGVVTFGASALMLITGCESLQGMESDIQTSIEAAEPVAQMLNAPTSGISGLAYLVATNVVTAGLAINRAVIAQKRKKAIAEIDEKEDTPAAADQAKSAKAKKVIRQITG